VPTWPYGGKISSRRLATSGELELAYAIGFPNRFGAVETFGTASVEETKIAEAVSRVFDLRPGDNRGSHLKARSIRHAAYGISREAFPGRIR
jgi:S-adenosylmethionine synthetase